MWIIYRDIYNDSGEYSHKSYFNNGRWLHDKVLAQKFENYYLAESALGSSLGNKKDYIDWHIERFID